MHPPLKRLRRVIIHLHDWADWLHCDAWGDDYRYLGHYEARHCRVCQRLQYRNDERVQA